MNHFQTFDANGRLLMDITTDENLDKEAIEAESLALYPDSPVVEVKTCTPEETKTNAEQKAKGLAPKWDGEQLTYETAAAREEEMKQDYPEKFEEPK